MSSGGGEKLEGNRKQKKCVKQQNSLVKLVIREDIKIHEVGVLASQDLVGMFNGRKVGELMLKIW